MWRSTRGLDYRPDRPLAEGACSRIQLVMDSEGKPWALKLLKGGREPALKEWSLYGKLPAIPGLLLPVDRGRSEAEGPWLLLPYCEGGDLKSRGRLSADGTMALMRRLLETLAVLHASGWVHRDLSPGNVLFDTEGKAWLADLGCLLETGRVPAVPRDGLGTPAYAAPEQLIGAPASPQGDLYALGAICYECLAGVPPFPADLAERTAARKLSEAPRPLREVAPGVPASLAALVEALLRIDARARPPDARAVLAQL
jgi:serine/threonine protein kinase